MLPILNSSMAAAYGDSRLQAIREVYWSSSCTRWMRQRNLKQRITCFLLFMQPKTRILDMSIMKVRAPSLPPKRKLDQTVELFPCPMPACKNLDLIPAAVPLLGEVVPVTDTGFALQITAEPQATSRQAT